MTERTEQKLGRCKGKRRVTKAAGEKPWCIKEAALWRVLKWTNETPFYKSWEKAEAGLALTQHNNRYSNPTAHSELL